MTQIARESSIIALYETHSAAEAVIKELAKAGVEMKNVSIIGKPFHTEEHVLGFYTAGDRMKFWGGQGALWGGLWGMLFGSEVFLLPPIGPLVVMGPLVGWIAGTLEVAAAGGAMGVLAAALASIGIPKESALKYELEVKSGKFFVLAKGTPETIERAQGVLSRSGALHVSVHNA